jgi:cytoskeletal protein CcmA (bactofilin family)
MSDGAQGSTGTKRTLVEEGTSFKGSLASSCPILVKGTVEGEISGPSIDVSEGGLVRGRVKVTDLRSRGELAGQVEAETVELSGRIHDQSLIKARSLEVKPSGVGVVFGECELCIGDEPVKEATPGASDGAGSQDEAAPGRRRRVTGSVPISASPPEKHTP